VYNVLAVKLVLLRCFR